ncbi:MAG TPA: ankyrin repeat domain-containing protein [Candidatus Polarisedimenticolaceae bacterium]|nr:ankyrin repeat domain-containing protein [Candidatus Polarisedimenticolaceae bacterium]
MSCTSVRAGLVGLFVWAALARADDPAADLHAAARAGDLAAVQAALQAGASVDAPSRYGATALAFASDKGHLAIVKLLIERGADVNHEDSFYHSTPMTWAAYNGHGDVVAVLLAHGATQGVDAVMTAIERDKPEVARAALASGKVPKERLSPALAAARQQGRTAIVALLEQAGVTAPPPATASVPEAILQRYVGTYRSEKQGDVKIELAEGKLKAIPSGQDPLVLGAVDEKTFRPTTLDWMTVVFESEGERVVRMSLHAGEEVTPFQRVEQP